MYIVKNNSYSYLHVKPLRLSFWTETTVEIIKVRQGHKGGIQREYLIGTKS